MICKDELRLIEVRARIATLEIRLTSLREKETSLLRVIGRDPVGDSPRFVDAEQFQSFTSSGEFVRELEEIGKVMADMLKEDLAETDATWKPLDLAMCATLRRTRLNA